jgi:hypothetical protein
MAAAPNGIVVTMQQGFEPGRNYELSYKSANPPISGLGLAAVRDITAFAKHEAQKRVKYAIGFGVSQSGRFLRTFLYEGMNTDEKGRQVFDGVVAHIAGAARLDVNRRWAAPTGLGTYNATAFPFADAAQKDPVSGVTTDCSTTRARGRTSRDLLTNTGVENRAEADQLIHTAADGAKDIPLPATSARASLQPISTDPQHFRRRRAGPASQSHGLLVEHALVVSMEPGSPTERRRPSASIEDVERHAGQSIDGRVSAFRRPVAAHADGRRSHVDRTRAGQRGRGCAAAVPGAASRRRQQRARRHSLAGSRHALALHRLEFPQREDRRNPATRLAPRVIIPLAQTKAERDAARSASIASIHDEEHTGDQQGRRGAVKDGYLLSDVAPVVKPDAAER